MSPLTELTQRLERANLLVTVTVSDDQYDYTVTIIADGETVVITGNHRQITSKVRNWFEAYQFANLPTHRKVAMVMGFSGRSKHNGSLDSLLITISRQCHTAFHFDATPNLRGRVMEVVQGIEWAYETSRLNNQAVAHLKAMTPYQLVKLIGEFVDKGYRMNDVWYALNEI